MDRSAQEAVPAKTDVQGEGRPLVLVPGALTGWLSWEPHAARLATRWRVIRTQLLCVDLGLRGEPLPPDYTLRTETKALLRALDALEVGPVDLVGWSYGGGIALDVALNHSERIRSLTLVEPDADWLLRAFGRFGADARALTRAMAAYGPGEVSEAQLERFVVDVGIVPPDVDPKGLPRWPVWVEHRQSLRIGDVANRHDEEAARLKHVTAPALLFKGRGSPTFMRDTVDLLGRELPNARVEDLPGGHALPLVSIDAFLAILTAFLDMPGPA